MTAVGTFLSVFALSFTVFQHWRKRQDEKFELLKKSIESSVQKETGSRKESAARIEGRVSTLEHTVSQRFENRLSVIEGELKGIKPILQSIQNWFVFSSLRRIITLQGIESAAGREMSNEMLHENQKME